MNSTIRELTLVIVESPVLADRLMRSSPPHITVFATGGFLWSPQFDEQTQRLKRKALPGKLEERNELRRLMRQMVRIVVATDPDPAGDFIAWTIAREFSLTRVERGMITSVGVGAIQTLLDTTWPQSADQLFSGLQNRYTIQSAWNRAMPNLTMKEAGLAALFGSTAETNTFTTPDGKELFSNNSVSIPLNKKVSVTPSNTSFWHQHQPISTFDAVSAIVKKIQINSYQDAQERLRSLFETVHSETDAGLISYPRSSERAYYQSTWNNLQGQWIAERSLNEFMPVALRSQTAAKTAHEAVHALQLGVTPSWVKRHLPTAIADVYELLYAATVSSITMPSQIPALYSSEEFEVHFGSSVQTGHPHTHLTPVLPAADLGFQLCRLGVLRPSGFGAFLDGAIHRKKISINSSGHVRPGPLLEPYLHQAENLRNLLETLRDLADEPGVTAETLEPVFTSFTSRKPN